MDVTYDPLRPAHHTDLYRLMESQEYLAATLDRMGMSREQFRAALHKVGSIQAILADGTLAGFLWIELRERTLHLHGLVLEEAFQGKGIGTLVLERLSQTYGQSADLIELGVHSSNQRAVGLYERLGFETVKVLGDLGFLVLQKPLGPRN